MNTVPTSTPPRPPTDVPPIFAEKGANLVEEGVLVAQIFARWMSDVRDFERGIELFLPTSASDEDAAAWVDFSRVPGLYAIAEWVMNHASVATGLMPNGWDDSSPPIDTLFDELGIDVDRGRELWTRSATALKS